LCLHAVKSYVPLLGARELKINFRGLGNKHSFCEGSDEFVSERNVLTENWTPEPSGSQSPLGGLFALDVKLKARTPVIPSAARAIGPQKCKDPVGSFSTTQTHAAK